MTLLPKVKLKSVVSFPASIYGRVGIDVAPDNGKYFIDLDYDQFMPPIALIPSIDEANLNLLLWDQVKLTYLLTPVSLLTGGSGGTLLAPPWTFTGNPTAGSAASTDVSITALPVKSSPSDTDNILIADNASAGAWKKISVASVRNPGSTTVTSMGGATGAISLRNGLSMGPPQFLGNNWLTVIDTLDKSGATDIGAALNAAIQAAPQFSIIVLPVGKYLTSQTIVINGGRTLRGMTGGFHAGSLDSGTAIIGTIDCATVVLLDGEGGSGRVGLGNLQILRATGAVNTNYRGLQLDNCNNTVIQDVSIARHGHGIYFNANNVAVHIYRCNIATINNCYVTLAGAIEINFINCIWGMNGAIDVDAFCYVLFNGSSWDTIRFSSCQWNQTNGFAQFGMAFAGYTASPNGNGEVFIDNLHCERVSGFFINYSGTAPVPRITMNNCEVNLDCPFFAGPHITDELIMTGNRIYGGFVLDQHTNFTLSGNAFGSAFAINACTNGVVTGNLMRSSATVIGACSKLVVSGNVIVGTLSATATGVVYGSNA